MSGRAQRWQGDPLAALPVRSSADGPVLDRVTATLLPDPGGAMAALRDSFRIRGPYKNERRIPAYQVADVVSLANYLTAALSHDLPTPDRRDTATIWDKWRKAILRLRDNARGETAASPYSAIYAFAADLDALEHDLTLALKSPGEVARHYCPWAADFFTYERLNPEAG